MLYSTSTCVCTRFFFYKISIHKISFNSFIAERSPIFHSKIHCIDVSYLILYLLYYYLEERKRILCFQELCLQIGFFFSFRILLYFYNI